MTYFPMFVSLEKKPCLIVGGGMVAARKCGGLLAFGAEVTVVAKRFPGFLSLHNMDTAGRKERLYRIEREFRESDLAARDWALVIAATDSRDVNSTIASLCRERRIPVNVADCRAECTFFFPAYCMEGNVAAGLTTSGVSPSTASALRKRLEKALPEWIAEIGKGAADERD